MSDGTSNSPNGRAGVQPGRGNGAADERYFALEHIYKVFVTGRGKQRRSLLAVRDVNLTIEPGEFMTFLGPSGCGKSTVLNMLAGLERPTEGRIAQGSREINEVNTGVGYMTQDDNLLPWRTLLENVELPLELQGVATGERRARAQAFLKTVGLSGFEDLYPAELSGGMRKRGSVVRTLLADDPVVLMDEPFGPLDAQNRLLMQDELLRLWKGTGKTIVFVTHDLVESIALSDRIVIFTSAPGGIKSIHRVPLPRPRDVFHIHQTPGFDEIYNVVWNELREEIDKTREARR
jgi:NitT/TauT family transport system ATP-binding protein